MDIENEEFLLFLKGAQQNQLRYLCVSGYTVNYQGYHRFITEDLDIWIAPTNENKRSFLNTLLCLHYTESEISLIEKEDFTTYFKCTLGSMPYVIDVVTIMHSSVSFDEAEKDIIVHKLGSDMELKMIPYNILLDLKLKS